MKRLGFHTPSLLAAMLALAALSPWTPLPAATPDAQAQSRHASRHSSFRHSGNFRGHKSIFSSRSRGFHRFNSGNRRSFGHSGHSGFRSSSRLFFRSHLHRPHTTLHVTRGFDRAPTHSYRTTPTLNAHDGWAHLIAGRPAQAQMVFATLAEASPTQAAPKVGYGFAALLRGDLANGERAFLRAHQVDSTVWQALSRQPEARAAAADLLRLPEVQASENLRAALTMLMGPESGAPADVHDYDVPPTDTAQ